MPVSAHALNTGHPCAGSHVKSPAEVAGLKPNDKIVSVDGKPVGNWDQLHAALTAQKTGVPIPLVVERAGRHVPIEVTPGGRPTGRWPFLGITATGALPAHRLPGRGLFAGDNFASTLTSSASAIGKLPAAIPDLFNKHRANTPAGQVSSVVGVGDLTGQVVQAALPWQAKVSVLLYLIASLNIFVGAFNLLPLLPLDGGHLAVVIFERIRAWFNRLRGRPDPGSSTSSGWCR